ncbi:MAG: class I SAM-dependent methyltransferase [Streptosporangiaceae bacterium]
MSIAEISAEMSRYWDEDAATYDDSPSHAPRRPHERAAWAGALRRLLPAPPARVLDAGAGTGFLSLLLAAQGYQVTAVDLSAGMLAVLRRKAGRLGLDVRIVHGDAADPPREDFDAVTERHLLWTLPDLPAALAAWRAAAPAGRLVLLEGTWGQGQGLEAVRSGARALAQRLQPPQRDHHAPYSERMLSALPHSHGLTPAQAVSAVGASGWGPARLERLRDVEWASVEGRGLLSELLGTHPLWAVTAGA